MVCRIEASSPASVRPYRTYLLLPTPLPYLTNGYLILQGYTISADILAGESASRSDLPCTFPFLSYSNSNLTYRTFPATVVCSVLLLSFPALLFSPHPYISLSSSTSLTKQQQ
ncbi:hypothetical protein DL98DRAFT_517351 [Cadophora sp. DSE1049]|nr:hypothetical protein DL98DRAFT_517351 [Cadophora sp. DSE1049]